jgi:hypothetical protein
MNSKLKLTVEDLLLQNFDINLDSIIFSLLLMTLIKHEFINILSFSAKKNTLSLS